MSYPLISLRGIFLLHEVGTSVHLHKLSEFHTPLKNKKYLPIITQ